MRPIRTAAAARAATFESLGTLLSRHRAVTRVSLAALSFTIIIALSTQAPPVIQAGPEAAPATATTTVSLLPQTLGVGLPTDHAVSIEFDAAMDPTSVQQALRVVPDQPYELAWSASRERVTISPQRLWQPDTSYFVIIAADAANASGQTFRADRHYAFTTQAAPTISDFQVLLADDVISDPAAADASATLVAAEAPVDSATLAPTTTAKDVSASSSISVSFSAEMDRADVERRFAINPEIPGDLSWRGRDLIFAPTGRLESGARYTVSLIGSHDAAGNVIGGTGNFSFLVQDGAQVTKMTPAADAAEVEPAIVELWFSQPMDTEVTNTAFGLTDASTGALVGGHLTWNAARTQLTYVPDVPFAGGRTFTATFDGGARDADGNAVPASLSFTTRFSSIVATAAVAPTVRTVTPVAVPAAGPATSLAGYALNQVNAARAAFGFAPVVLDAGVSAVASSHAWDQATNGYFSHTGRNGSSREGRLAAGGVSFGWSGENQCYHVGMSEQATLDWCHAQFMAEPYPGHWNHIANVLNPNARRMGVGIATAGSTTVITWDFTD